MINLLPSDVRRQIRASQTNSFLIKCLIYLGFSTIFLMLICGGSYLLLSNAKNSASNSKENSSQSSSGQSTSKTSAETISNNLASAKTILDQSVSYSKIVTNIAASLPDDMIVNSVDISDGSLGSPITLKIYAKTSQNSSQLKTNFESSPSGLFSSFNITSSVDNQTDVTGYPTLITATVNINRSAAK